jgi:hypothetical protein
MAPKTHFKIPLNKAADSAAPTPQGVWTSHTAERIPLPQLQTQATSSKTSHPNYTEPTNAGQILPLNETMETYPLRSIDPEEDAEDVGDVDHGASPSNVSFMQPLHRCLSYGHKWGQWLQMCAQYLHLLLENKGLTRAATFASPISLKAVDTTAGRAGVEC